MRLDKKHLQQLARALWLDPRQGETTETLFQRCLTRAEALTPEMAAAEASDPDRERWPWTE